MDSDLIRGNVDTIVLKCLANAEMYGVEICNFIREASGGTYNLKPPTLYSALTRLQKRNLVSSYWQDSDIGGRRHYYRLTEQGFNLLDDKKNDWQYSKLLIDNLVLDRRFVKDGDAVPQDTPRIEEAVITQMPAREEIAVAQEVNRTGEIAIAQMPQFEVVETRPIEQPDTNVITPAVAIATEQPAAQSQVVVTARNISELEQYIASAGDYITVPLSQTRRDTAQLKPYILNEFNSVETKTEIINATFAGVQTPIITTTISEPTAFVATPINATAASIIDSNFTALTSRTTLNKTEPTQLGIEMPAPAVELKPFVKHATDRRSGKFVLYSKLRLVSSALVFLALAVGLVCTSLFLKSSYTVEENSFLAVGWICAGVYLLANVALYAAYPKHKRVINARTRDITFRAIITACIAIAAVSINILAGLSAINANDFLVYWVVPCVLAAGVLVEGLAIWGLRRNKFFLT